MERTCATCRFWALEDDRRLCRHPLGLYYGRERAAEDGCDDWVAPPRGQATLFGEG